MGGGAKMIKATKQIGSQVPIIGESFENRKETFLKEVDALGGKYKIALRPELKYTTEGIVASFKVFDVKEKPKNGEQKDPEPKK